MKKIISRTLSLFAVVMMLSFAAQSQIIVKVRPTARMAVRPACPSPRHVWIDGDWAVRNGRYVWVDGFWTVPRQGYVWVGGHWKHRRHGYHWAPGHWNRRW